MTYDDVLSAAIARASERGSIRQAAQKLGITDVSMGQFIRWRKTGKFPSDDLLIKIAEIADQDKIMSHFAMMAEKSKNPVISEGYRALLH